MTTEKTSRLRASVDRLPPHSLEAEQGVLGCLLLNPLECINEVIERFGAAGMQQGGVFYDLRHVTIFAAMVAMHEERIAIDMITVQQRLKDRNQLEAVGGHAYVSSLVDAVPSAANLKFYADIVWEKYVLRRMITVCTRVVADAYEHEGDVEGIMDAVERDVLAIVETADRKGSPTMGQLVQGAVNLIDGFFQNKGALTGVPTGFNDLDEMTNGLQPGDMVVIAARPSVGKTSLAMNIVEHAAVECKMPVGVFSLEMTSQQLVLRMLCSLSRVNLQDVRKGFLAERDFPKLVAATGKLKNAPIYIDDTAGLSILQLRAKARRMHAQYGIKLIVIDYLQLLHSTGRFQNRQEEIAQISSGIKALAKELGIPVIVLAQVNREQEKEKNRKPRMSDLRESGAIEQDADVIGMLYKPQQEEDGQEGAPAVEQDIVQINLLIAKQRNGPTGDVGLAFRRGITRFENLAKEGPDAEAGNF